MKYIVLIMAGILIVFVLVGSVVLHLSGVGGGTSVAEETLWQVSLAGSEVETLKAIDLTGDGRDEVLAQTPVELAILTADGDQLFRQNAPGAKSTMGDYDGDGTDEFALAEISESGLLVTAMEADGRALWQTTVPAVGPPSRGASLDLNGDGLREAIFGTETGTLVVLDGASGQLLWRYDFPPAAGENALVRGSDDVRLAGASWLAAANYGGLVVLLGSDGQPLWQLQFPQQLRRLRTADVDGDGTSELLLGGVDGLVMLASAADGRPLWQDSIGARVDEARFLELDGDPTQTEIVVGSRNGGVLAYSADGQSLWKRTVAGKVKEFAVIDADGDGQNELLVGADKLSLLDAASGKSLATLPASAVTGIDVGDFGAGGGFVTADGTDIKAMTVALKGAPIWRSPIVAGLMVAFLIGVLAILVMRLGWAEPQSGTVVVHSQSVEALLAKKKMLLNDLDRLERLNSSGRLDADQYLAQSRSILERLEQVEADILTVDPNYQPRVLRCPSCAAPVELGQDRCGYCGHVLL
jgi:outer membrane protein assembly factor BamB